MPYWVPITALFGLCCMMIIPAPGWEGVAIGAICVLVILVSAITMLLDRAASRILVTMSRARKRRLAKNAVHRGSGIAKKVG
ncbi:MAG: hypothetical protein K2Y56_11790 [Methylobacterium sp.]|uniref:hypothetical protein n=1 Tax=Methylobacterium sp. TaxID=409 RepID=UPI0025ED143B|nr:hypothetical protein [Methylobacterium sp.]MBX9932202.1 hypothetical protein [Methylobacterium sp.]